jgi:hypothetical protein
VPCDAAFRLDERARTADHSFVSTGFFVAFGFALMASMTACAAAACCGLSFDFKMSRAIA